MSAIWKFPIEVQDEQEVAMPEGARILTVQMQAGQPCLWALITRGKEAGRRIEIFGTGHPIDESKRAYIGTFQQGPFVWHVFEKLS